MKKIINLGLSILVLEILLFAACKKADSKLAKPFVNTAPIANAGKDTTIVYPVNTVFLDGNKSTDNEDNIVSYSWKNLDALDGYINIEVLRLGIAFVQHLENKTYQFELTVTDQRGATSKDTVLVSAIIEPPKAGNTKAGDDITLSLPYNRTYLKTFFKVPYPASVNITQNWQQVSGSNSATISAPNSSTTGVGDLRAGVYQFELTVNYWNQLVEKDTTTVTVLSDNNIYTSAKLFENVQWTNNYPYLIFNISNISSIVPAGSPMNVYVKLPLNTEWEIVAPQSQWSNLYEQSYSINNDVMQVYYNYDPSGWEGAYEVVTANSSIKIVY